MFKTIDRLILRHEASGELLEIVWNGTNASIARAPEHLVRDLCTALAMPIPAQTGILLPDGARGTLATQLKPGTFDHGTIDASPTA